MNKNEDGLGPSLRTSITVKEGWTLPLSTKMPPWKTKIPFENAATLLWCSLLFKPPALQHRIVTSLRFRPMINPNTRTPSLTLPNSPQDDLPRLLRHAQERTMPALHLHNLHRLPPTLSALPRTTHLDRRTLVRHGERLVVFAQHVRDGEIGTAVVLRGSEEGFEDVWEEQRRGVRGGGGGDVVVEDWDWVGDGCCGALCWESVSIPLGVFDFAGRFVVEV